MRGSHRIALGAILTALGSFAFAGTASAAHVTCGSTITTDTTLDSPVGPCPGDGIIVGASGITLNLNGQYVLGAGGLNSRGVVVNGQTNVTVTGPGTVLGFNSGIAIVGGSSANSYGSGNTVDNVTVVLDIGSIAADYGEGITIKDSDGNTVKRTNINLNGPYAGITLLGNSDYNDVGVAGAGNTIENNIIPSGTSNQDDGIRLEPDYSSKILYPDNNRIVGNTVRGNALDGISVLAGPCTNVLPAPCTVTTGVTTANTIKGNTVTNNGVHTYAHRKGDGIRVFARAEGNIIGGPATGDRNTVTGNAASGIRVDSESNTIEKNTATGNCVVPDPQRPCVGSPLVPTLPAQGADLYDSIVPCGSTWTMNTFGTANQTCIS